MDYNGKNYAVYLMGSSLKKYLLQSTPCVYFFNQQNYVSFIVSSDVENMLIKIE